MNTRRSAKSLRQDSILHASAHSEAEFQSIKVINNEAQLPNCKAFRIHVWLQGFHSYEGSALRMNRNLAPRLLTRVIYNITYSAALTKKDRSVEETDMQMPPLTCCLDEFTSVPRYDILTCSCTRCITGKGSVSSLLHRAAPLTTHIPEWPETA